MWLPQSVNTRDRNSFWYLRPRLSRKKVLIFQLLSCSSTAAVHRVRNNELVWDYWPFYTPRRGRIAESFHVDIFHLSTLLIWNNAQLFKRKTWLTNNSKLYSRTSVYQSWSKNINCKRDRWKFTIYASSSASVREPLCRARDYQTVLEQLELNDIIVQSERTLSSRVVFTCFCRHMICHMIVNRASHIYISWNRKPSQPRFVPIQITQNNFLVKNHFPTFSSVNWKRKTDSFSHDFHKL